MLESAFIHLFSRFPTDKHGKGKFSSVGISIKLLCGSGKSQLIIDEKSSSFSNGDAPAATSLPETL
ncbi:MAG: hypothetical protein ACPG8W_12570, partial [Candidatus Promineifilaceae bacterium]